MTYEAQPNQPYQDQAYPAQGQAYPAQGQAYPAQGQAYQAQGQAQAQAQVQAPAYQVQPDYYGIQARPYSDWLVRVGAYLLDGVPVIVGWIVLVILAVAVQSAIFAVLLYLIGIVGFFSYSIYNRWVLGGRGQTFGKKQMKIKLVSEETGQPIGTWRAFLRDLCHIYDGIYFFGYLLPIWDPKHQTQADKIMKTIVIPA